MPARSLPRTLFFALGAALPLATAAHRAAAQLGQPTPPAPADTARDRWPAPGTKVRLRLTDSAAVFGDELFVRRPPPPLEARLVALDSATLAVQLPGRGLYTFPPTSVRRLDARTAAGPCGRSGVRRVACVVVGTGLGMAAGLALSPATADKAAVPFVGAFGAAIGFGVGRDRWVPVRGWARGR